MFEKSHWYSSRLQCDTTLARWGYSGQPVLVFPTAGGDAEEIERFKMIEVLEPLLSAGRIKIYSCDSVAGRVFFDKQHSVEHRMYITHQFHQYVKHEVVPAIRTDCKTPDIPLWTTGASIGAFHAVAVTCRFPDLFHRALGMSGSYDILRFIDRPEPTDYFHVSSPLHFLPHLAGRHLDVLRTRYIHLASGEGKWENIGESFRMGKVLGDMGIPNWVESWGNVDHDWVTWRAKLPKYLADWTSPSNEKTGQADQQA
ncbi:MAG TPA: alpha/beta hydrolase-fold protein [Labilithrix sp.]|nr:alpha/beta hydrolase-fold protein [Labilithrix sp.]